MSHTAKKDPYWFDPDDLTIPDFLRVEEGTVREWKPPPPEGATTHVYVDPREQQQRDLRSSQLARQQEKLKEKNRRGFERMQAKHQGERYVRPKRKNGRVTIPGHWVKVDNALENTDHAGEGTPSKTETD